MAHRIWSWFRPKTEADIVGISSDASTSVRIFLPRVDDRHGLVPSVVLGRKFRVIVSDNPGWDSRWFNRPGAPLLGFRSWASGPGRTFGDFRSGSSPGHAYTRRSGSDLLDSAWPLGLNDVIDSTVAHHQPSRASEAITCAGILVAVDIYSSPLLSVSMSASSRDVKDVIADVQRVGEVLEGHRVLVEPRHAVKIGHVAEREHEVVVFSGPGVGDGTPASGSLPCRRGRSTRSRARTAGSLESSDAKGSRYRGCRYFR
jgi:hypothetical protein